MKKTKQILFVILTLLTLLSAISIFGFVKNQKMKEREMLEKKVALSKVLGVSIEKYPYFPGDYFAETIKIGMPKAEVHRIMKGYEKVYNAFGDTEFYYYFSKDDDVAYRILITYDEKELVKRREQEDENSRTLPDPDPNNKSWVKGVLVPGSTAVPKPSWGTPIPDWQGVPVMPGATRGRPDDLGYYYYIEVPMEEAEKFYKETMKAAGWTLSKYEKEAGGYGGPTIMMEFQRGREKFDIDLVFLKPSNVTAVDLIQMEP